MVESCKSFFLSFLSSLFSAPGERLDKVYFGGIKWYKVEKMFQGRYEYTIDNKGRVSLPAKFREVLNKRYDNHLIITNFDSCLVAYPLSEWLTLVEKMKSLSLVKKDVKSFQRFFISGASECVIDKQGRLLIPPALREYAGLEKDVVFVGMINRLEIWNKERWDQEVNKFQEKFNEFSDTLADLGL